MGLVRAQALACSALTVTCHCNMKKARPESRLRWHCSAGAAPHRDPLRPQALIRLCDIGVGVGRSG